MNDAGRRLLVGILAVGMMASVLISGCGKKEETPTEDTTPDAAAPKESTPAMSAPGFKVPDNPIAFDPNGPAVLTKPTELWDQGSADEAVEAFVAIDWASGPLFGPNAVLGLKEKEFQMFSASDRDAAMSVVMAGTMKLKNMCDAVLQKGASSPDKAKYVEAVKNCAKVMLQDPEALAFVKLMATGIENAAIQAE